MISAYVLHVIRKVFGFFFVDVLLFPRIFCYASSNSTSVFLSAATLRVRIRGEQTPELLLELQDDERSQTFFQQVMKAKHQGEDMLLRIRLFINFCFLSVDPGCLLT